MQKKDILIIGGLSGLMLLCAGLGIGVLLWQYANTPLSPEDAPKYLVQGQMLEAQGRIEDAIEAYERAVESDPTNVTALLAAGDAHESLGDAIKALELFQQAAQLEPNTAEIVARVGALQATAYRNYEIAHTWLVRAVELDPTSVVARFTLAGVLTSLGRMEEALVHYDWLVESESFSDGGGSQYLRGDLRYQLGDYEGAMRDYRAIGANGGVGRVHLAMGEYEDAERVLGSTGETQAQHDLGWALWGQGKYRRAIREFERAVEIAGGRSDSHFGLGASYLHLGRYDEAIKALEEAGYWAEEDGDYARFFLWVGMSLNGDVEGAEAELRELWELSLKTIGAPFAQKIGGFLLGELEESELLGQASLEDEATGMSVTEQQCEAFYYAGMKHIINGDETGGVQLLKQCVATETHRYYEYHAALAELRRRGEVE